MRFDITVINKVATPVNPPTIICGNSDYSIRFIFDEEWDTYVVKTARFTYIIDSEQHYQEVVFAGSLCPMPILSNITEVNVGVYAGELRTTTPAKLVCEKSILCGSNTHTSTPKDAFNQLMELLENNFPLQAGLEAREAAAYAINELNKVRQELAKNGFIEVIKEQNDSKGLKFWVGTQAEYEAIDKYDEDCFYITTDDTFDDDVNKAIEELHNKFDDYAPKSDAIMSNLKVTEDPTEKMQVATKQYADTVGVGLWKTSGTNARINLQTFTPVTVRGYALEQINEFEMLNFYAKNNGEIKLKFKLVMDYLNSRMFDIYCGDRLEASGNLAGEGLEVTKTIDTKINVKKGEWIKIVVTGEPISEEAVDAKVILDEVEIIANRDTPCVYYNADLSF